MQLNHATLLIHDVIERIKTLQNESFLTREEQKLTQDAINDALRIEEIIKHYVVVNEVNNCGMQYELIG